MDRVHVYCLESKDLTRSPNYVVFACDLSDLGGFYGTRDKSHTISVTFNSRSEAATRYPWVWDSSNGRSAPLTIVRPRAEAAFAAAARVLDAMK